MRTKTQTKDHRKLTPLQQSFVNLFDGSIKNTALKANIKYPYARELYTKPHIKQAIAERHKKEYNPLIATRQQRQAFWTQVMNDNNKTMPDRLKASELLGKSEGDFVEKVSITNPAVEKIDSNRKSRALQIVCFFGDIYQLGSGESADKPPVKQIESHIIDENQDETSGLLSVSSVPDYV
jgi:phage terminase small subunit